ncbi:anti-sigma factor family protein [Streptomyces sp. MS06]|uniref:anti-sigma factor family protein n=1 Tax=Streptomyces sp. MS06 TaxID=3385974 RepID=UPI00399FC01A
MSGSRPDPAEQHLGDRLSALVDGELGHDTRERVLAHVATCPKCKVEVDAQRRLKNAFAETAPPAPSESFLARLQGLPGGGGTDGGGSPLDGGAAGGHPAGPGAFGTRPGGALFDLGPSHSGPPGSMLPGGAADRGFRIHAVGRSEPERSASRGLRFAFAAAGAVSLAALALGGLAPGAPIDIDGRGGSNVTPARPQGAGSATAPESQRRRTTGPLFAQGAGQGGLLGQAPAASTAATAPLVPGVLPPAGEPDAGDKLTASVMAGAAAVSPLIRPLDVHAPIALPEWHPAASGTPTPGLLAAPLPDAAVSPGASSAH